MNRKIRDLYLLLMYLLAAVGIILVVVTSIDTMWISLLFTTLWLFSFTVRNLLLYNIDVNKKYVYITYMIEIIIALALVFLGNSESISLILCITLGDCFIEYGIGYGVILLSTILLGKVIVHALISPISQKEIIQIIYNTAPILMLTALIAYLVGKLLKSSTLLENSVKDVEEREVKLRGAYHELHIAYKSLENMATLKERNRIAREIHDTVGHTLTTVIVEMEAGKMLSTKDETQSREKYEMAQTQAVKALNEMRASVRMLTEEGHEKDLMEKVTEIIEDTSKHTEIVIRSLIEIPVGTRSPYDDLILRALSELIANGIRHGRSTAFFYKLQLSEKRIHFLFQDNGVGCENIIYGFGLRNMKKGIEAVGGKIAFRTEVGEGFETEIELSLEGGLYE